MTPDEREARANVVKEVLAHQDIDISDGGYVWETLLDSVHEPVVLLIALPGDHWDESCRFLGCADWAELLVFARIEHDGGHADGAIPYAGVEIASRTYHRLQWEPSLEEAQVFVPPTPDFTTMVQAAFSQAP